MSFGKDYGPTAPLKSSNPFVRPPPPSSATPAATSATVRAPRVSGGINEVLSPPPGFESSGGGWRPYQPSGVPRPSIAPYRWGNGQRPTLEQNAPEIYARPSIGASFNAARKSENSLTATIGRSQELRRTRSPPFSTADEEFHRDFSQTGYQRTLSVSRLEAAQTSEGFHAPFSQAQSSPVRDSYANVLANDHKLSAPQGKPVVSTYANNEQRKSSPGKQAGVQPPKRTRSPPIQSFEEAPQGYNQFGQKDPKKRSISPPSQGAGQKFHPVYSQSSKTFLSSANYTISPAAKTTSLLVSREPRSPLSYDDEILQGNISPVQETSDRPSSSPAKQGIRLNVYSNTSQQPDTFRGSANEMVATIAKTAGHTVSKRTRSPLRHDDEIFQGNSDADQGVSDREMEAKAKRLARFKLELGGTAEPSSSYSGDQKISGNVQQHLTDRRNSTVQRSLESAGTINGGNASPDPTVSKASSIIGSCPDMCPESEREERERKGDLDQFERLDGDRNQTSEFLAVKKYTRTAEREAYLIRPMPVLQKTMDYLLSLLDQPYDESFLGMYNFLWDRMRAIRMDLRMQHIFNKEAITMLEQMVRLHIIAMHELCEYTKGEGFSEGFDAHLNIEQMNKTSVELFQMYDDHRKKGINVPTEKEFRGYYALLKLDKHPGYRVEPAELSLDLAKMIAEVRQTPEVLFARDVARVCRAGNYVAFFRLARKASYLQACLMHAHFTKLRTQALAALHSSLQGNQGLPISRIASWLVLEEEDMERLLEYHGFVIRDYEEPYMVKEGPFLNAEDAYPTKCSNLVHLKRSRTIVQDVTTTPQMASLPTETRKEHQLSRISKQNSKASPPVKAVQTTFAEDEEMADSHGVSSPKDGARSLSGLENPVVEDQIMNNNMTVASTSNHDSFLTWNSPGFVANRVAAPEKVHDVQFTTPEKRMLSGFEDVGSQNPVSKSPVVRSASGIYNYATYHLSPRSAAPDKSNSPPQRSPSMKDNYSVGSSLFQSLTPENIKSPLRKSSSGKYPYVEDKLVSHASVGEREDKSLDIDEETIRDTDVANYHDEVADSKLKLTLRLWRRHTTKLKQLREARQASADAALNSLSFGPPVQIATTERSEPSKLDFGHVMWERHRNHEKSWSRLNVSDVTADILGGRNPCDRCVCWKIVLCSQLNELEREKAVVVKSQVADLEAGKWLLSKLMPINESDDDLVFSSPGLSIWKKWINGQSVQDSSCCLSVVRETQSGNLNEIIRGACSMIFLVSESIPWEFQKAQFHNLLISIPPGSCLPLLILSSLHTAFSDASSIITNELGLHGIDKSRIGSFMIVPLTEKQSVDHSSQFFSDKQLRSGLQWLAGESPVQPRVSSIKVRDLILSLLVPLLDRLEKRNVEASPEDCITAFNKAVDLSWRDIAVAASANPRSWPCPEIALIPDSSDSHSITKWYLPSVGWSLASSTAPLEHALRYSKLPRFSDDISWLSRGSCVVEEIEDKRLLLEHCLVKYMADSSNGMGAALAAKEAKVVLQSNTKLELRDLSYYIVPNWVAIFRRVYNWRLVALSNALPAAYVLGHEDSIDQEVSDELPVEGSPPAYSLSHPPLDEVIEVGCSPLKSWRNKTAQPEQQMSPNHIVEDIAAHRINEDKEELDSSNIENTKDIIGTRTSKTEDNMSSACKEADKLSKLLDRCSILQDRIGKRLSFYF